MHRRISLHREQIAAPIRCRFRRRRPRSLRSRSTIIRFSARSLGAGGQSRPRPRIRQRDRFRAPRCLSSVARRFFRRARSKKSSGERLRICAFAVVDDRRHNVRRRRVAQAAIQSQRIAEEGKARTKTQIRLIDIARRDESRTRRKATGVVRLVPFVPQRTGIGACPALRARDRPNASGASKTPNHNNGMPARGRVAAAGAAPAHSQAHRKNILPHGCRPRARPRWRPRPTGTSSGAAARITRKGRANRSSRSRPGARRRLGQKALTFLATPACSLRRPSP